MINSFDIDGVIYIDKEHTGIFPGPNDVIITGRSFEEKTVTLNMLHNRGIFNKVYFNHLRFDEKSRESSGLHKANILNELKNSGVNIWSHYEDDEIQIEQIQKHCKWINIIHVHHNLTPKENVWHGE